MLQFIIPPLFILPGFRFNPNRPEGLLGFVLTPTFPTVSATPVRKPMNRVSEAAVCRECSYAALSVQPCRTVGATVLPLSVPGCYYRSYLCWAIGIPMLNLWYQDAKLFWYHYSKVFTMAKIRDIRVVVIQSMTPHK